MLGCLEVKPLSFYKHLTLNFAESFLLNVINHSKESGLLYQKACLFFPIPIFVNFYAIKTASQNRKSTFADNSSIFKLEFFYCTTLYTIQRRMIRSTRKCIAFFVHFDFRSFSGH